MLCFTLLGDLYIYIFLLFIWKNACPVLSVQFTNEFLGVTHLDTVHYLRQTDIEAQPANGWRRGLARILSLTSSFASALSQGGPNVDVARKVAKFKLTKGDKLFQTILSPGGLEADEGK